MKVAERGSFFFPAISEWAAIHISSQYSVHIHHLWAFLDGLHSTSCLNTCSLHNLTEKERVERLEVELRAEGDPWRSELTCGSWTLFVNARSDLKALRLSATPNTRLILLETRSGSIFWFIHFQLLHIFYFPHRNISIPTWHWSLQAHHRVSHVSASAQPDVITSCM